MDEDPFLNTSLNLATYSCDMADYWANLALISVSEISFTSILNDSNLRKELSLTLNTSGTKERT